jgi:hypothetical protein
MIYKHSIRVPIVERRRRSEALLSVCIGAAVSLLILFAVFGCREMPNTATALDAANKALIAVDVAADIAVTEVSRAREDRIAACRILDLQAPEDRKACLGPLAEPRAPKAEAAAEAYDAAVKALAALAEAIAAIEAIAVEGAVE